MGVVLAAGGSLQWFRNTLCQDLAAEARRRKIDPYDLITTLAAEAPAGCDGLYFLPYLTGERTPHADPHARAAWVGLSNMHTRAHMARAVIEGATYAMRDSLQIIRGMGVPVRRFASRAAGPGRRSGGPSRPTSTARPSGGWLTKKARPTARPCWRASAPAPGPPCPRPATRRSARAARPRPNRRRARLYNALYPEFGCLYHSLRENFRRIAERQM